MGQVALSLLENPECALLVCRLLQKIGRGEKAPTPTLLAEGPFRTKDAIATEIVVFCYCRSILLSMPMRCAFSQGKTSKNWRRGQQTEVRQSSPINDTNPIRKFSIDPLYMPPKPIRQLGLNCLATAENQREKPIRKFSIDPHRRYGHRLRTLFLRTPFPRLLNRGLLICATIV